LWEIGVDAEILSGESQVKLIKDKKPRGLILSGGPASVYATDALLPTKEIYGLNIPILGICYGLQIVSHQLAGKVDKGKKGEYGLADIRLLYKKSLLFKNIKNKFTVWMSHFDEVVEIPVAFKHVASTQTVKFACIENSAKKIYCVSFHPEVAHTQFGLEILKNFCQNICGIRINLSKEKKQYAKIIKEKIALIKNAIGGKKAICAVSGGIDSTTAAILAHKAIGDNLTCVYVDTGLMRIGETEEVKKVFSRFKIPFKIVSAEKIFLDSLRGVVDPELKRKNVGETFIRVFEKSVSAYKNIDFLIQGTIYPDVIESKGTKHSDKIKTHHNVGGLPEKLDFKIIEPLRDLYKDQVRIIALKLGVPYSLVWRQVFPGPGLCVRIIGEVTKDKLVLLRKADKIVDEEIRKKDLTAKLWMSFAILAGIKTTGVVGDERIYGETIAIRAITSKDAMTADWARLPHDLLAKISSRITSEVKGVCRVVYDITTKPPGTMEWE
jgi:GMP synthase (glutamine-hydrolysing)